MPYGLIDKITTDGFTMWSGEGYVNCVLSRRLRKKLEAENFSLRVNLVVTVDYDDDAASGEERDEHAPRRVTFLDKRARAVLLVAGPSEFIETAVHEMTHTGVKLFRSVRSKRARVCLVTADDKVYDHPMINLADKQAIAKMWVELHAACEQRPNVTRAARALADDKMTDEALTDHRTAMVAARVVEQDAELAVFGHAITSRLDDIARTRLKLSRDRADLLCEPPPELLVRIGEQEVQSALAVAQACALATSPSAFWITDERDNILRNLDQIRASRSLTIHNGCDKYSLRNFVCAGAK